MSFISKPRSLAIRLMRQVMQKKLPKLQPLFSLERSRGLEIARDLGIYSGEIPASWEKTAEILKSKPGRPFQKLPDRESGVFPVIHCLQEIPCDPCSAVCPRKLIEVDRVDIRKTPVYQEENGCMWLQRL